MAPSVDPAIIQALGLDPAQTSMAPHGHAGFASSFRLSTVVAGQPTEYFVKTGSGKDAEVMFRGACGQTTMIAVDSISQSWPLRNWILLRRGLTRRPRSARGTCLAQGHPRDGPQPVSPGARPRAALGLQRLLPGHRFPAPAARSPSRLRPFARRQAGPSAHDASAGARRQRPVRLRLPGADLLRQDGAGQLVAVVLGRLLRP